MLLKTSAGFVQLFRKIDQALNSNTVFYHAFGKKKQI